MKRHTSIFLVLLSFCLLFCGSGCNSQKDKSDGQAFRISPEESVKDSTLLLHKGDKAADFEVEMLNGQKIRLSDLKGKVVMLTFWATWCPPCNQEFKAIPEQIIDRFKGRDFVLLPISRGEKKETVARKMEAFKKKGIDFPVGIDPDRSIYNKYAGASIPRNFLIDKKGTIVYCSKGYSESHFRELTAEIENQLKR